MDATKVFVVEDSPLNMELVTDILEVNGYEVLHANEARTGIEMAVLNHPDLIFMDIQLAGMDGLTAIKLLKGDNRTWTIPVTDLTAHAMAGDRGKAESVGCSGYAVKPMDTRQFPKMVASFLNFQKSA